MGEASKRGTQEQRIAAAEDRIAEEVERTIAEIDASGAALTHEERAWRNNAVRFLESRKLAKTTH